MDWYGSLLDSLNRQIELVVLEKMFLVVIAVIVVVIVVVAATVMCFVALLHATSQVLHSWLHLSIFWLPTSPSTCLTTFRDALLIGGGVRDCHFLA